MANRTTVTGGVWAKNAADVPGTPIGGTAYAKSGMSQSDIEAGQKFDRVFPSSDYNEILRRLTTLMDMLEKNGVLPWCATTTYSAGAECKGSNGRTYYSLAGNNAGNDPTATSGYWALSGTPVGAVFHFAAATPPAGFLECDGSEISRSAYAALFAAIGTTYGAGDGSTTFALPDLRDDFIRGARTTSRPVGTREDYAIENITGQFGLDDRGANGDGVNRLSGAFYSDSTSGTGASGSEVGVIVKFDASKVVKTSTETRPRNVALLACIKY